MPHITDTSGVFVIPGIFAESYFADPVSDLRGNICAPFHVSATVMPPGFPDAAVGTEISGVCVAPKAGYWLVYQQYQNRFCCFWGERQGKLGAHGVFGSPLYCWSA